MKSTNKLWKPWPCASAKRTLLGEPWTVAGNLGPLVPRSLGPSVPRSPSLHVPCAQHAPQEDQLPQMIGIMVRGQQGFAENGLAIAMRDARIQVGRLVSHQRAESLQVLAKGVDGTIPGLGIRGLGVARPVAVGELGRLVLGVPGELENVPLRN